MKFQPSEVTGARFPSIALSACVLGLLLCPFAYIGIGALTGFAPAFSFLTLPPLLLSAGYLYYRLLSRPEQTRSGTAFVTAEVASWTLIVAFIILVSNFALLTKFERIGLSCALFFLATLVSWPVVLIRHTALEERMSKLPAIVSIVLLTVVLLPAIVISVLYVLQPPAFL